MNFVDPSKSITFTPEAESHFAEYISKIGALGVRLKLEPSGCAGFSYVWENVFDYHAQEEPYLQQQSDFVFILAPNSHSYLAGSTIDIEHLGAGGRAVKVISPKQAAACGCGDSVSFND